MIMKLITVHNRFPSHCERDIKTFKERKSRSLHTQNQYFGKGRSAATARVKQKLWERERSAGTVRATSELRDERASPLHARFTVKFWQLTCRLVTICHVLGQTFRDYNAPELSERRVLDKVCEKSRIGQLVTTSPSLTSSYSSSDDPSDELCHMNFPAFAHIILTDIQNVQNASLQTCITCVS